MSDVHNTAAPVPEVNEPTTAATTSTQQPEVPAAESAAPVTEPEVSSEPIKPTEESAIAPVDEKKDEVAPATTSKAADKVVEPITEGQLAVKGPGLLKSIVPSKKEFWLSDSPVTPQHLDLYMRGEKPEVSHAVVAWASQTGKGLLFFNKKGETSQTRPHSVLPLYEATDLKKAHPHEITFKLHAQEHVLKAANDAEQEGWFVSLQRAIEVGKAEKETIRASEGYKAEIEKLNKPNTVNSGVAGAAAAARSKSQPKHHDEARRAGSDPEDAEKQKSRSTSRGVFDRLKGKKDETEVKREEKKEEKREEKEEKKAEKQEAKAEKEAEKHGEAAPVAALAGGSAPLDAPGTAERAVGAPVQDNHVPGTEAPVAADPIAKSEEKKNKRGSIFGRVQSGWGSMKSPSREKDQKEAELKPVVPPKDTSVSETAPQIPEPASESSAPVETAASPVDAAEPSTNGKPAESAKEKLDEIAPGTQKKGGLLSGLPFMNKRERSVSPSANMKDAPATKEATPAVPPKEEGTLAEPAVEQPTNPVSETPAAAAEPVHAPVETPAEKIDEPVKPSTTEATSPTNEKRASVFGNLGRRASKAFKGFQAPRRENAAPAATTPAKTTEETAAPVAEHDETEAPKVNGESKPVDEPQQQQQSIGDVTPDAVNIGQAQTTPTVTASA